MKFSNLMTTATARPRRATAMSLVAFGLSFSGASAAPSLNLQSLMSTTQTDLAAAKADADSRGDIIASQCYVAVENHIATNPLPNLSLPNPVGVISAFQGTRDAVKNAESVQKQLAGGIPADIEEGCGPLALDVQNDLGQAGITLFGLHL